MLLLKKEPLLSRRQWPAFSISRIHMTLISNTQNIHTFYIPFWYIQEGLTGVITMPIYSMEKTGSDLMTIKLLRPKKVRLENMVTLLNP